MAAAGIETCVARSASSKRKDLRKVVAEPEHDERKKGGFRWITALGLAALVAGYTKRFRWANLKARKITYQF